MENTSLEEGEKTDSVVHSSKRKRSNSKNSSDDTCNSDDGECELYAKYFVPTERSASKSPENDSTLVMKPHDKKTRKRKYLYNTDVAQPKKSRRFFFITASMTKPRRIRTAKSENEKMEKTNVQGKKQKIHVAKSDGKGNIFLVHRTHFKSDLFFNDEKKCNYEACKKKDLSFHVVDEIALEGLDGITLEAFWKRLRHVFPNNISKTIADRIWRLICNNKRISFYILREPREKLIAFDRFKYMDFDAGVFVDPFIDFKDIYPLVSVNGTEIRGSCSTFDTRKENNGVRKFTMDKIRKLYDQKLVFVADQLLREKALINDEADPNIELQDLEYCLLERIGRSREQGELTQGKVSLKGALSENKNFHHNRKSLELNFLIVNQFFYLKSFSIQHNISGGLVHLPRFYNKRKTLQCVVMEQLANILKNRPNHRMELTEFWKIFGRSGSIIKLMKTPDFRTFFKTFTLPYRKLYPHATKSEYMNKNGIREKQINMLRMIDPFANVSALMETKYIRETPLQEPSSDSTGHKLINYEYLRDIFIYILSTGTTGVTIKEIQEYLQTDYYSVRLAVRKLLLRNVIDSNKIDLGRQQSLKFTAKCVKFPEIEIELHPPEYQLTDETISRVLQAYDNIPNVGELPENRSSEALVPTVQYHFNLEFTPFMCSSFLTETIDAISEELTIYDIIIKGRDKLLLIQSNLLAHYISEWDGFLLKRDDCSKTNQLLQDGYGKIIRNFLLSSNISEALVVDNLLIFNVENVKSDTIIGRQFQSVRVMEIVNFANPVGNSHYVDDVGKIYVFEAMFDDEHLPDRIEEKLKNIFDRLMVSYGKKRRETLSSIKLEPKIHLEVANNLTMEKFMGPSPQLLLQERSIDDDITIEIYASTQPEKFHENGTLYESSDVNLTQRYIDRANLILKMVNTENVVKDVRTFFKNVRKKEDGEGYDKKVCKKSIDTILSKLVQEGYVKILKLVVTGRAMTRTHAFICLPGVDANHSYIRSTIDQLKMKFYDDTRSQNRKTIKIKKSLESPFSISDVKNSITELKYLTNAKTEASYKFNRNIGKKYGFCPKFLRIRILHEHLFYIIREMSNNVEPLDKRSIFELCKSLKIKISTNDITELPPIYCNEVSWKMFIPPLPPNDNFPKGWALACDIILRMPLSVFVKIYKVSYEIPELEEFLQHPIKRYYLLKHLPVNARTILIQRRKYFHSIYEILAHLCYLGLLQFGPRSFKEKDQLFVYLNSKASLYDTSTSKPGYNLIEEKKYKKLLFEFKTSQDLDVFWSEMLRICMSTQLGKRKILDGQFVTIEDCNAKPAMMETLKAKTFKGAIEEDVGIIPGDHKGGAGFDSSLWTCVKRNWVMDSKASTDVQSQVTGLKKEKMGEALPQPIRYEDLLKRGATEKKIYLKSTVKPLKKTTMKGVGKKKKGTRKKFVRKIIFNKTKRVREYYDAVDKAILKNQTHVRVDWDDEEDQLLRYARVAAIFLCPILKKQFIPYNVIRDVLHRIYPNSKNKTSRAIQRRIYILLMSDEIMKIMETNVENFLNSNTVTKYFAQIHNRYKCDVKFTEAQIYIAFIYLMAYILKHRKEIELLLLGYIATVDFFSDPYLPLFEVILQNVEEETSNRIYNNPKTIEDIEKDTIRSVIHCSMTCKKNSVGWAFQLFHIYNKFSDNLIRATVADLKKCQFLVVNKNYEEKSIPNNWHSPLKLSHLYNVMKSGTYPLSMYSDANRVFMKLPQQSEEHDFVAYNEIFSFWEESSCIFEVPEKGIILNPEIDDHSEVIEELSKRFLFYLEKIYERTSTTKKNPDGLDTLPTTKTKNERDIEEIKNDVRKLIFRVPYLFDGNVEKHFKSMLNCSEIGEINNYIRLMIVELKRFAQDTSTIENLSKFMENIDETVDNNDVIVRNLGKYVFAIQSINSGLEISKNLDKQFEVWMKTVDDEEQNKEMEEVDHHLQQLQKNQSSGMENCIKRAQQGNFPSLDEIKEGMMDEISNSENRTIPHITDLIMLLTEGRFPELDSDVETIDKMKQHFIIQYPKLLQFIVENSEEFLVNPTVCALKSKEKLENIKGMALSSSIVSCPKTLHQTDISATVANFIKGKEDLGASPADLKQEFSNLTDLATILYNLVTSGDVIRTGICTIVYVHHEYQGKWVMNTFCLTSGEREVFQSKEKQEMKKLKGLIEDRLRSSVPIEAQLKPWTKLDGSLNEEIFNEWLCIIISHCVDYPNIPLLTLFERYHYIKPVDIYFLLEVLQNIGCVEICLYGSTDNNIFSSRGFIDESRATCLDEFTDMFVKIVNVPGLSFGSFLEVV